MAKPRGKQIPVAAWWIDEAILRIENDRERKRPAIGKKLGDVIGRKAFDKSTLSRILNRDPSTAITLEFTQAVCKLYDMPSPAFFPRSREEALDLTRQASKYPDADPDRDAAHKAYIKQLEQELTVPAEKLRTVTQTEQDLHDKAKRDAARQAARRRRS